ncbi:MAG TPA: type IV pilus assembly protein PilM [Capillimicrobium sp.]
MRRRPRHAADVVGLDIQPGEVVAATVRPDSAPTVQRAVSTTIEAGLVKEGEVADVDGLAAALKALFSSHKLPTRVRVGLASQRAVMRVIDLPPLEDERDIAAAIRLQAPDHIAMPLEQAVIDHQTLGTVETPDGRRTRVVVVAAQRDSVSRLLAALRGAGLRPVGIDLSAFALVRALRDAGGAGAEPVLYADVAGVTTLAMARGAACELTRISPVGLEALTARLAEREGIVLSEARRRLLGYGRDGGADDEAALAVLDHGLAELADDLRNTIEFHAAHGGGPGAERIVLSGPAATIPGFERVLGERVGLPVALAAPASSGDGGLVEVPATRACVAAGLAFEELAA